MTTIARFVLAALLCGIIGQFDLSIDPVKQIVGDAETAWCKIDVTAVGYQRAWVDLATIPGCTVEPATLRASAGAVLSCDLPMGTHVVTVTGASLYHTASVTTVLMVSPWRAYLPVVVK